MTDFHSLVSHSSRQSDEGLSTRGELRFHRAEQWGVRPDFLIMIIETAGDEPGCPGKRIFLWSFDRAMTCPNRPIYRVQQTW
jgi:hypothetical protein